VICTSATGTLYVLKKKEFIRTVLHDKIAHKCLEEQIEAKAQWRNKRIEEYIDAIIEKKPGKPMKQNMISISQNLFEYEKNKSPKVTNFISNKPKKAFDISELANRKKTNLTLIDKSFFDPIQLKEILKESSILKLLSSGCHKRNFMILNAVFKQQNKNMKEGKTGRNFSEPNLKKQIEKIFFDKNNEFNENVNNENKIRNIKSIKESSLPGFLINLLKLG